MIPTFFLKLAELVLTILCILFLRYGYDPSDISTLTLWTGTFTGYTVILTGELIGEIQLMPVELIQELFFSVIGCFLFGACGVVPLVKQQIIAATPDQENFRDSFHPGDTKAMMNLAYVSLANSVIFLFDVVTAVLDAEEYAAASPYKF